MRIEPVSLSMIREKVVEKYRLMDTHKHWSKPEGSFRALSGPPFLSLNATWSHQDIFYVVGVCSNGRRWHSNKFYTSDSNN